MNRYRIGSIAILVLVVLGTAAAARTMTRTHHGSPEMQALETIQAQGALQVAERVRRVSGARPSAVEISAIQALKRQTYINLLETTRNFARERGDLKTEQDVDVALEFWIAPREPRLPEAREQSFDKSSGSDKP